MDFFKSAFSDDPHPSDPHNNEAADPNPDPNPTGAWSFGGLIKTIASRSESVILNYRRDLEEFGSGLKKETAVIREVASRAVEDLPGSFEVGASVAQESLESVGQAIDNIGSSVWKSTAEIIAHGRDSLLAPDLDSNSSDNDNSNNSNTKQLNRSSSNSQGLDLKRYSRFDAQLRAIQCDMNTYLEEPEDLEGYNEWKPGFVMEEKREEIGNLIGENGAVGEIYGKLVPSGVDEESFWTRYFYRVHKLRQVEDARAKLVKRAISGEEEDLSWDFDDEDGENDGSESKVESRSNGDVGNVEVGLERENDDAGGGGKLEVRSDEKGVVEGKTDGVESGRDSDVSVVSSQPLSPEEDLGWDEIEDIGSTDENIGDAVGSADRVDLRKRLSAAEEDEDLSWDIEDGDDNVPAKS
ncbi:uncharacterized protein LOC132189125 [Corylus avellana]|uniref:uncharacterized protein LOC132189125 n=1 Tax=Corylus avellana TaxID=13451 RepID=UPI001E1F009F|nr:uncharacterized protein LOC132189125 [Corylus avellana]